MQSILTSPLGDPDAWQKMKLLVTNSAERWHHGMMTMLSKLCFVSVFHLDVTQIIPGLKPDTQLPNLTCQDSYREHTSLSQGRWEDETQHPSASLLGWFYMF